MQHLAILSKFESDYKSTNLTQTSITPVIRIYDDASFERLFKKHYRELHAYASVILKDGDMAEEMVQNMFLKFWEKRELLQIKSSIKAYLYKCTHNDCLNYIKHQKIKTKYIEFAMYTSNDQHEPASAKAELTELEQKLSDALNELPEHCRTIFQMSRFEELKYKEIANELGISIKTVENQMGKALKILRIKLADFITVIIPGIAMFYKNFFN